LSMSFSIVATTCLPMSSMAYSTNRVRIAEDPVTGTAGGPVGAYIVRFRLFPGAGETGLKVFSVCQGEAIGRAGILQVTACVKSGTVSEVSIAGRAVIAFKTEISL
ncbi:MAG: PhzF family phenazine biosynthesis protein, partial [Firmicutes bacterium]|nr:PhzF family phenazine biosynthesis protein [Bacillota bacterium]